LKQEKILANKALNEAHAAEKHDAMTSKLLKYAEDQLKKVPSKPSAKEIQRQLHNAVRDSAVAKIAIQRAKAGLYDANQLKNEAKKA
jgi:hypothetical protein